MPYNTGENWWDQLKCSGPDTPPPPLSEASLASQTRETQLTAQIQLNRLKERLLFSSLISVWTNGCRRRSRRSEEDRSSTTIRNRSTHFQHQADPRAAPTVTDKTNMQYVMCVWSPQFLKVPLCSSSVNIKTQTRHNELISCKTINILLTLFSLENTWNKCVRNTVLYKTTPWSRAMFPVQLQLSSWLHCK